MLKISHLNLSFKNKVIFKESEFIAYPSSITVITGISGSGKSTLFNQIAFMKNKEASFNYLFENEDVTLLDEKGREEYRRKYICYINQRFSFIHKISVLDNLYFLLKTSQDGIDKDRIVQLATYLGVEKKLSKFPKQLSGGEKQKIALIYAICSKKSIVLLDEPTASLDSESILKVINLLKEEQRYIIISTHDDRIVDVADRHYHIENHSLVLKKSTKQDERSTILKTEHSFSIVDLSFVLLKHWKRKPLLKAMNLILVSILIILIGFSMNLGNRWYNDTYLVGLDKAGLRIATFDGDIIYANGYPIKTSDVEVIKGLDGCETIYPIYRFEDSNFILNEDQTIITSWNKELYENGKQRYGIGQFYDSDNRKMGYLLGVTNDTPYTFETYFDNEDYSKYILEEFNTTGIYINQYLAQSMTIDQGSYLSLSLFVPQYDVLSKEVNDENLGLAPHKMAMKAGVYIDVKLPIRGVVEYYNINSGIVNTNAPDFYISQDYYSKLLEEYKQTQRIETEDYILEPFVPNIYVVEATNAKALNELIKNICDQTGLNTNSGFLAQSATQQSLDFAAKRLAILAVIGYAFLLGFMGILQYIQKNQYIEIIKCFTNLGIPKKKQYMLLGGYRIIDWLIVALLSTTVYAGLVIYINSLPKIGLTYATRITMSSITMMFFLSFVVVVLMNTLPVFFYGKEKGGYYDSIK